MRFKIFKHKNTFEVIFSDLSITPHIDGNYLCRVKIQESNGYKKIWKIMSFSKEQWITNDREEILVWLNLLLQ